MWLPGYVDVGLIPEGARDIVVQEVEEAANFLALRGEDTEEYYLNGRYIIQWKGEYEAGGATFYYERSGNLENLTSPGPTREPIMIQVQRPVPSNRYCPPQEQRVTPQEGETDYGALSPQGELLAQNGGGRGGRASTHGPIAA